MLSVQNNLFTNQTFEPTNSANYSIQCESKKSDTLTNHHNDIFTYNNNSYENITFDPRIQFCLKKINKSIRGSLLVDHFLYISLYFCI